MWDQIIGAIGQLQTINSETTKPFRIKDVSPNQARGTFTLIGEEHREQSLSLYFLDLLGLVDKPLFVESTLDETGLRLTFFREAEEPARELESDIFVTRKALSLCLISVTRPATRTFVLLGLLTIFTIIGPVIAYILFRRQKHKVSFGFDSSSDVGLVLTFVGDRSLLAKLLPLMEMSRNCLSHSDDIIPANHNASDPPAAAGRDIECRINGKDTCLVSKAELIQMARDGSLKKSDQLRRIGHTWVNAEKIPGLFR